MTTLFGSSTTRLQEYCAIFACDVIAQQAGETPQLLAAEQRKLEKPRSRRRTACRSVFKRVV